MVRKFRGLLWAFFLSGMVVHAYSQPINYAVAAPGFSGLGLTPAPAVTNWGGIEAAYTQANPGAAVRGTGLASGHNMIVSVGLLPGIEIAGRLATNDMNCNLYGLKGGCPSGSYRDLSASAKMGHTVSVAKNTWLSGAVGVTDFGGAATNFRSYYGVLGIRQTWWGASVGQGFAVSAAAPLAGFFGHAMLQLTDPLQVHWEKVGRRSWIGARYEWPLGHGHRTTAFLDANRSLQNDGFTPRFWFGGGIKFALDAPASQAVVEREQTTLRARAVNGAMDQYQAHLPTSNANPVTPIFLAEKLPSNLETVDLKKDVSPLIRQLVAAGFEDISIGQMSSGEMLVVLDNSAYNWNQLDALGVAMGTVAQAGHEWPVTMVQIKRHGVPIFKVIGRPKCMLRWLQRYDYECGLPDEIQFFAAQHAHVNQSSIRWWAVNERASTWRSKLFMTPAMDSRVGTEYGVFDSTWGANFTLQTPLWSGATADVAYVRAIRHSEDYASGNIFSDFRIDSMLHRVMLHQHADLGKGVSLKIGYGRLAQVLQGHHEELRWESPAGLHKFSLTSSSFAHREVDFQKKFRSLAYRYYVPRLESTFEVMAGQFWHGDKGFMALSRHWFGDTSVTLFLRRSQFPQGSPALFSPYGSVPVTSVGIEISLPLTPRTEVRADWIQPRGDDRFSYGIQSVVRAANSTNYVTPYFGVFAPIPLSLDGGVYNFDRGSQAYLMRHLDRVRGAWVDFKNALRLSE